ncbi:unnamed protein product [Closterium sp. NIES-53]
MKRTRQKTSLNDETKDSRLLSLPDDLLLLLLARVNHPCDRCSVALSCSRLRRLSRHTPHSLNLFFVSPFQYRNVRSFLKAFDDFSRVFTLIISLTVEVCSIRGSELLASVGASCPKLETLKLVAKWGDFHMSAAAWMKLAKQCPLLTSLELHSPFARRPIIHRNSTGTPLPPIHAFPALHSLALLIPASKLTPLTRCSSLTSLTLWNPLPSTLSSLASSSSSSVRTSLKSLTLHSAKLESCLAPLASLPRLTSLAFLSCTIDPFDLHALARSLHTLTHLTIHNCPLVSSHALAALVEANQALSSLSLRGTTYRLFSAPPFRSLLHLSSPRLHTLELSGLPSFRPGMLAHCSGLQSLVLKGMPETLAAPSEGDAETRSGEGRGGGGGDGEGEGGGTVVLQRVSLESLVGLLVRVVQRGGEEGEVGGEAGGEEGGKVGEGGRGEECEAEEVDRVEGANEATTTAGAALARVGGAAGLAAAAAAIAPRAGNSRNGEESEYVDIRTAAAAARADLIESSRDMVVLMETAKECHTAVPSAVHWARMARAQPQDALSEIKFAIAKIRSGISTWRALRVAVNQKDAATSREDAVSEAFAAATTAGVFVGTLSRVGEGEGGLVRLEDFDGMLPGDDDLLVDAADAAEGSEVGEFAAGVDPEGQAVGVMESLLQQYYEQSNAATESLRTMRVPRATAAAADADADADAGTADVDAAADASAAATGAAPADGAAVIGDAAAAAEQRGGGISLQQGRGMQGELMQGDNVSREGGQSGCRNNNSKRNLMGSKKSVGSSRRAQNMGGKSCGISRILVEVACPPLHSLTLQAFHFTCTPMPTWLPPSLPSDSPLMCLSSAPAPLPSSSSSSSCSPSRFAPAAAISRPGCQPQSFESVALAAAFGQLKRLTLVSCFGLKEEQLVLLLRACPVLVALIVEDSEDFSDRVVARSRLEMLTQLAVLECDKITADGIGGLLGSFPKLHELKVEASKVGDRARRELLRAGVTLSHR